MLLCRKCCFDEGVQDVEDAATLKMLLCGRYCFDEGVEDVEDAASLKLLLPCYAKTIWDN